MGRLDERVAIVTGASSGIGRAIAQRFAREGAIVVVADVRTEPLEGGEPTVETILADGGRAEYHTVDVSSWEQIDALRHRNRRTPRGPGHHGEQRCDRYRHADARHRRGRLGSGDGRQCQRGLLRLQAGGASDA